MGANDNRGDLDDYYDSDEDHGRKDLSPLRKGVMSRKAAENLAESTRRRSNAGGFASQIQDLTEKHILREQMELEQKRLE